MTIATLFSGGEGVGVGAQAAGLRHLWGIEYDDDVARVARDNGFAIITLDVLEADPADFACPTVLHASPPCPNFSNAKTGGEESENDLALAWAMVRFVESLKPDFFTLENVYQYRKSESWHIIAGALKRMGYRVRYWHLNAADYGVPQTRKRMFAVARLDGVTPLRPQATHAHPDKLTPMFDDRLPWVGWHEAIEDLIPTLPDSEFADWQLARLPDCFTSFVMAQGAYEDKGVVRERGEPTFTITANTNQTGLKGFVVGSNTVDGRAPPMRDDGEPMLTVDTKTPDHIKAYLVDGQNAGRDATIRQGSQPSFTLTNPSKTYPRAFIVGGQYAQPNTCDERLPQTRNAAEPVFTVTAVNKGDWRGWTTGGRVVQMTPRVLARFQSFPDWYELPEKRGLACRIIGNAVPPLLYQRVVESLEAT